MHPVPGPDHDDWLTPLFRCKKIAAASLAFGRQLNGIRLGTGVVVFMSELTVVVETVQDGRFYSWSKDFSAPGQSSCSTHMWVR